VAVEEEVVEETVVETPPPPPAPPPVAAAPEPEPEPEPVAEAAPEPEAPAQVAVADEPEPEAAEPEAAVASEEVEIAAFDPVALPPAANDGSTRYGIEIGTVGKRDELRPLWREYLTKHAALVAGLQPRRVLAPDKKWRLIAGPFANAQDAEGACSLFQKAGRPCSATVYAGDAL
jgi:outer membrane biosynthesis protein TonB